MAENIPSFRLGLKMWFTSSNEPRLIFGAGDIRLLESLVQTHNLTQSSKELEYSYKYAWQKIRNLNKKTGKNVAESHRGGYGGGGQMEVSSWGKYLITIFNQVSTRLTTFQEGINSYLSDNPYQETSDCE